MLQCVTESDRFDFNDKLGDKSVKLFEEVCANKMRTIYGAIWKYAKYAHDLDASAPTQSFRRKGTKRCLRHPGLGRKAGYPVFNPMPEGQSPKLSENKDLVRIFLNQHYGTLSPR
jgi:hypothetical protein